MIVTANGKRRAVTDGATIEDLLSVLRLQPELVVIEHNGKPLRRELFALTTLLAGDRLEIAQMVGGADKLDEIT
jgi:thiamine biosynthesis protein ThiS